MECNTHQNSPTALLWVTILLIAINNQTVFSWHLNPSAEQFGLGVFCLSRAQIDVLLLTRVGCSWFGIGNSNSNEDIWLIIFKIIAVL